jgi:hypothetical protein
MPAASPGAIENVDLAPCDGVYHPLQNLTIGLAGARTGRIRPTEGTTRGQRQGKNGGRVTWEFT